MRCRRALPPLLLVLFACRPDPGEVDLVRLLPTAELRTETAEIEVGTPAGRLRLHEGFGRDERAPGPAGGEAGGWVWALGERSRLVFDLLALRPVRLAATGWSAPEPGGSVPTVQASVNGHPIGSFVLPTEETTVELDLPAAALRSGENVLDFDYPPGSTGPVAGIAWRRFRFARLGSAGVPAALANADAIELPWRSAVEFSLESIDGAQLRWSGIQAYGGGAGSLEVVLETDGEPDELLFRGGAGGSGRARLGNPAASGRAAADWGAVRRLSIRAIPAGGSVPAGGLRLERPRVRGLAQPAAPASSVAAAVPAAGPANRPNVLIYLIDTLRADHLSAYGYPRPTSPAIDALARSGVLFEHARAHSSWTRPTAAAILTGLHPISMQISGRRSRLPQEVTTLAEHLAPLGYRTGFVTTNVNTSGAFGFAQGNEVFRYLEGRVHGVRGKTRADRVTQEALKILDAGEPGQPFLLYLHTVDPHAPYLPTDEDRQRFVPQLDNPRLGDRATLAALERGRVAADPETLEQLRGLYDAEIAFNDAAFGTLVAALVERGLWDDTIVVLVSDHGEEFLEHGKVEHGRTLYEEQLRVPLIWKLPRGAAAGTRVSTPVEQIDIVPTLLELVGAPAPAGLPGRSLTPAFAGLPLAERLSIAHLDRLGYIYAAVHDRGYKLIRRLDPEVFRFRTSRELFDLAADPGELVNRFHDLPVRRAWLDARLRADELTRGGRLAEETTDLDGALESELRALGYLN